MLRSERTVRRVRVDVRGMNDGKEGERNDNRGGCDQSVVVEIRCKRQSTGGAILRTTEDSLLVEMRMLAE